MTRIPVPAIPFFLTDLLTARQQLYHVARALAYLLLLASTARSEKGQEPEPSGLEEQKQRQPWGDAPTLEGVAVVYENSDYGSAETIQLLELPTGESFTFVVRAYEQAVSSLRPLE